MGVFAELVDFDHLFHTGVSKTPIIVNEFDDLSESDKADLNNLIYTRYSSDLLSNLPSCECGEIIGEHNVGVRCTACNTLVTSSMEQDLEPLVWMRSPNGVEKLINPIVWTMLNNKFTKSGFEIIRWICDTTYKAAVRVPPVMESVQALNLPRGYNNFVQNFDEIIGLLFSLKEFKPRKAEEDPIQTLIRMYRHCLFSTYLPLPNRSLLVIEENNLGTYVDPIITGAVDAIRTIASIDSPLSNHSIRTKENRTIKTIAQLAEFYDGLYRTTLARKEGVYRKHVFGTRSHFSFRAVISSLTNAHDYDEIHIPWGIGISLFRLHLLNKLLRRGFTPNEAMGFLNEHAQKHHPLLEELFSLLIKEARNQRVATVFQRNPSLERGSAQLMYITKVKSDPDVPTVSLSILSVKSYNADFDGDQLNGTLSLDLYTEEELRRLAPHMGCFTLDEPRKISKNISIPAPVVATIASWLDNDVHAVDAVRMEKTKALAMA